MEYARYISFELAEVHNNTGIPKSRSHPHCPSWVKALYALHHVVKRSAMDVALYFHLPWFP